MGGRAFSGFRAHQLHVTNNYVFTNATTRPERLMACGYFAIFYLNNMNKVDYLTSVHFSTLPIEQKLTFETISRWITSPSVKQQTRTFQTQLQDPWKVVKHNFNNITALTLIPCLNKEMPVCVCVCARAHTQRIIYTGMHAHRCAHHTHCSGIDHVKLF